ncbi:zinc metalloproteinase nas-4-like [Paramacrobiotus metropolitanus]|uniref:zinc metalloproteinase nas-4-like n=1 Tax=Paramacrobiotus metropolitanus TaxID=2943436 RepID=UPI002446378F|nr:zinc metalloproteinase nas-4-like [Paramacrobiotus metropolitanus]
MSYCFIMMRRIVFVYFVCVSLGLIRFVAAFRDNRDYDADMDDRSDDLPEDWENRIDPATMKAHLSEINSHKPLKNDIMFADASVGFGVNDTAGNQSQHIKLWGNGKVPYHISELFGSQDKSLIHEAIQGIERKTLRCVTFTARRTDEDYIHFKPGDNCSSYVGVRGGMQPLFLHPARCMQLGIVQHEILHALGLFHEHSRNDRNARVIIFEDEIMEGYEAQYRVIPNMPTFGTAYDLESLMHYGPFDFAKSVDHPVIIPRYDGIYRMGQREGLSVRDAAKLRNAYRCEVGWEDQQAEDQERLFPGFSVEPMKAEQCALQFADYCGIPQYNRENCTRQAVLAINCTLTANETNLRAMATAMGHRHYVLYLCRSSTGESPKMH